MKPESIYFPGYVCVLNKKIYDECYYKMLKLIEHVDNSKEIEAELLKILSDDENKITLDDVLRNLSEVSDDEKDIAIGLGLDVALADDFFSDDEEKFFSEVCTKIKYDKKKFDDLFNTMKEEADRELNKGVSASKKQYGKGFYQLMSKVFTGNIRELFNERYINCLLSGSDYSTAIKKMRDISNEDIVYSKEALKTILHKMEAFIEDFGKSEKKIKKLASNKAETSENSEVFGHLDDMKKQIAEYISQVKEELTVSLIEKEIAAKYYTISFMGRTKAGKSTLHSVILGGINKEFIGAGKERTTRYNRIYKWNGIRIIDTPGIGAPGGQTDAEIAKSIVHESDLICYVVTSDSIQETEFEFLKQLRNQNKPIVILLNKKENLSHPIHKRKFLENPLFWYERKDDDSIEGHLTRIKEYAEKYYNNTYFDIYPVQLMAAQLSLNESDKSMKKKLYNGSRIKHFLDDLRIQILENGKIKRSQTMLNGSIYLIGECKKAFKNKIEAIKHIKENFEKESISSLDKIKKSGEKLTQSIENGIEAINTQFIEDDLRLFANENYDVKQEDEIKSLIEDFMDESGFNDRIKTRVELETETYKNEVESILKQLSENLSFSFDALELNFDPSDTFDFKSLIKIAGSLASLIGGGLLLFLGASNPIGWVLSIGGLAVSFLSGLFKSKEKKIKEAQDKLYNSIKSSFQSNMESNVNKITKNFKDVTLQTEKQVGELFTGLIKEFESLVHSIEPLFKICEDFETKLNKQYALRVLNFAIGKDKFSIQEKDTMDKITVEHDFSKQLKINTDLVKRIDTEKLKYILQEDIILEEII